jgi:hypothetical protein
MNRNILYFIGMIFFSGCIITNTPGFYSGYSKLTEHEKNNIVFTDPDFDIFNLKNEGKIYSITGFQLQKCILNEKKSLVYIWSPNCNSEKCYSVELLQAYCETNGFSFFLISEYYDMEKMKIEILKLKQYPMFSINERYYNTRYCNKYFKLFVKDLLNNQVFEENDIYRSIFIFENGKFNSTSFQVP